MWESKVLMGRRSGVRASLRDWQSWDPARWDLDASAEPLSEAGLQRNVGTAQGWNELCEPEPEYVEVNNTLVRMMMTGPEDPKLLSHPSGSIHGDFSLIYSSFPPEEHRPGCKWTLDSVKQVRNGITSVPLLDVCCHRMSPARPFPAQLRIAGKHSE